MNKGIFTKREKGLLRFYARMARSRKPENRAKGERRIEALVKSARARLPRVAESRRNRLSRRLRGGK